jgi:hypothetical protein
MVGEIDTKDLSIRGGGKCIVYVTKAKQVKGGGYRGAPRKIAHLDPEYPGLLAANQKRHKGGCGSGNKGG